MYFSEEDSAAQSPLDEALETVTALLVSASGKFDEQNVTSIHNLVEKFISQLSSADGLDGERRQMPFTPKKLEQTIQVSSQRNISSTLGLTSGGVDLEATNARKVESKVDKKKLEKAERKIRAKQDKKVMKNVEYEASRLLDQPDSTQSYEEFFMQVNPLQLGTDSQTKSKDIKVDSIDVSISGKRILTDTSLTLAYGRRYGLVGQNGIGKSTLLRALSRREVAIPTHISILHVEQEVSTAKVTFQIHVLTGRIRSLVMTHLLCKLSSMPMCGGNICSPSRRYELTITMTSSDLMLIVIENL